MKNAFTLKLSLLTISCLFLSFQLSAKDYTYLLKNPSFEYGSVADFEAGAVNPDGTTVRFCPWGWQDSGNFNVAGGNSYGINSNVRKGKDGLNICWASSVPFPDEDFIISQEVTGLPAGKYKVSCHLVAFGNRLTTQRLFANNNVQYFGKETDYGVNLTTGETNTFAGWDLSTDHTDADGILKPMSVIVEITEGEPITIGIKTGNMKKDGIRAKGTEAPSYGWFKVDNFHIESYPNDDPNDYTSKIKNPSFELQLVGETEKQITLHNGNVKVQETGNVEDNKAPYGWSAHFTGFVGNSYGVNQDGNNMDGAVCCWAQSTPMPSSFELYQDITGLPAGEYIVSCSMFVAGAHTTQRLFANNHVQYYGTEYDYMSNVTAGEINTYAGHLLGGTGDKNGRFLQPMGVSIILAKDEPLRIGLKTSNMKFDGSFATDASGWFKVDNFRLQLIEAHSNIKDVKANDLFSIKNQEGGFVLNLKESAPAYIQVLSLSGQTLYSASVNAEDTFVALPNGLYIVKAVVNGAQAATKVLVR